jgi:tetratricopeptide (TPR) repeat protein
MLVLGRFDEAYEQSSIAWREEDDPGGRPNAACIHALCAAAAGHGAEAIEAGEEVARIGGSYLDRIRAHIARALGLAQLGRSDEAIAAVDEARLVANGTDDIVHQLLTRLAEGVIGDIAGSERAHELLADVRLRLREAGISSDPWEHAFRKAAAA